MNINHNSNASKHELTPADELSIVREIRRRLSDPANWGSGNESMKTAPHCVMGHAVDVVGAPKVCWDGASNYGLFEPGMELAGVNRLLAETAPLDQSDMFREVWKANDRLHSLGDHTGLLAWLDRAVAKAEAALGKAEVGPVGGKLKPAIEATP